MTATTEDLIPNETIPLGQVIDVPVEADSILYVSTFLARKRGAFLATSDFNDPNLLVHGSIEYGKDQTDLADAEGTNARAQQGEIYGPFDNSAAANEITNDHIGLVAFAANNRTLSLTSQGGKYSPAGAVYKVDSAGKVYVWIPQFPLLTHAMASAGAVQASYLARGVVTADVADLSAFTVASNDDLTYSQGQVVLLAGQTTAAQCGLYSVGVVAAGVAPLTRIATMRTGAVVNPGIEVEVGEGTAWAGSTWKSFCAAGAVIGTNDPVFYPKHWRQTVTLASGTYTIGVGSTATPDEALFLRAGATVSLALNTPGGTLSTNKLGAPSGSRVTGKAGTAVVVVNAYLDNGSVAGSDTSTVDVLVTNW